MYKCIKKLNTFSCKGNACFDSRLDILKSNINY